MFGGEAGLSSALPTVPTVPTTLPSAGVSVGPKTSVVPGVQGVQGVPPGWSARVHKIGAAFGAKVGEWWPGAPAWLRGSAGLAVVVAVVVAVVGLAWWWLRRDTGKNDKDKHKANDTHKHNNQNSALPVDEVVPTEEEMIRANTLLDLRPVPGKGNGVVAKQRIPAWTCLGGYPGKVYTAEEHQALVAKGLLDHTYAIDFWMARPGEIVQEGFVLDPRDTLTSVHPRYRSMTLFVNEPSPGKTPNVAWVGNFKTQRVELWTARPVEAGEELTICYGKGYGRNYKTSCTRDGVELYRYAVGLRDQKTPLPWYDVVSSDNRAPEA